MGVDMLDTPEADVWVSMVELARMTGVSKQAVSKRVARYVSDGLLQVRQQGRSRMINAAAYTRLVRDMTDPAQSLRNPAQITRLPERVAPTSVPSGAEEADALEPQDNRGTYNASKARKAAFDAENARLDYLERIGNLVRKDQADAKLFDVSRRIRDRMLSLPAVCAERLAAAPDARAIRVMLAEEIRGALASVARELEDDSGSASEAEAVVMDEADHDGDEGD